MEMNRFIKSLVLVCAVIILSDPAGVRAQNAGSGGNRANRNAQGNGNGVGRGNRANFDPAQAQQRRMDQIKATLEITNEDEWKIIQDRLEKVMEAQRATRGGGMGMMMGGRRNGANAGGTAGGTVAANAQDATTQRRGGGPRGEANPAAAELEKALSEKATPEVVAAKLASYRDSRKAAETKLEAAQADLQKIVTRKQEAHLVLMGLLK